LLDAVTDLAASDGYAHLTVERLRETAGVSRASFYQYFLNVDDCFWSAYRQHAQQLVSAVATAAGSARFPSLAVLDALVDMARAAPAIARLLMRECLAAGPAGLSERDALITAIERTVRPSSSAIDLPLPLLIGATFRFLSIRLDEGTCLDELRAEVHEWASAFAKPPTRPSFSGHLFQPLPAPTRWPFAARPGTRGRGTQRERIIAATAGIVREVGARGITVADIVAVAGVSRRSFYNEFRNRSDALIATYEHAFQETLAACTPAFFAPRAWPERVWHGSEAFSRFLMREPLLAYIGFVECYAIGPGFAPRVHDTQLAFTLFLEEGYRQRPEAASLSRACSTFIAAGIFEAGFQAIRRGPQFLRRMQPLGVYMALAPFIGSEAAEAFVTDKLAGAGTGGGGDEACAGAD
jgi:AcrR family transcriptional regulator